MSLIEKAKSLEGKTVTLRCMEIIKPSGAMAKDFDKGQVYQALVCVANQRPVFKLKGQNSKRVWAYSFGRASDVKFSFVLKGAR